MRRLFRRPWLQHLCLSAASLSVFILAAELLLSAFGYGKLEIYEPDPVLFWRLRPNQDRYTKVGHKKVHINSHGTRGPSFDAAKPPRTLRLVSLGDSRTFGWGLGDDEAYSARLQKILQHRVDGGRLEVINAGVNAWSYPQIYAYVRDHALKYSPDFLVLADANLWTQFGDSSDAEFVRRFMWSIRLKNLLRRSAIYHYVIEVQLEVVYQRYRHRFIPVDPKTDTLFKAQQRSNPDRVFRDAIENLVKLAIARDIVPVLVYIPSEYEVLHDKPSTVLESKRDLSRRYNVPFVDLTSDLRSARAPLYLDGDPIHLNSHGNEVIARALADLMTPLARQRLSATPIARR